MKSRYNLALIPHKFQMPLMALSHFFSPIAYTYLLGPSSLPHITLCQFRAKKSELRSIWSQAKKNVQPKTLRLRFDTISCTTSTDKFWVSLIPDQQQLLTQLHNGLLTFLNEPLVKQLNYYDPHLTLCNTCDGSYKQWADTFFSIYSPIEDDFSLCLGLADDAGQLVKIIHTI